jgi:hypothetical protein
LAIGAFTSGVGWSAVVQQVGALIAKQATQELLLGSGNKLVSNENLKDLIVTAVSASIDEFVDVRKRIADVVDFENTQWMERMIRNGRKDFAGKVGNSLQNLGGGLAEGMLNTLTRTTLDAMLLQKYPTAETLAQDFYTLILQSAGRALHAPLGTDKNNPGSYADYSISFKDRLKKNMIFKELVKLCEVNGRKTAEWLAMDTRNMTGLEVFQKLWGSNLRSMASTTLIKSVGSAAQGHRRGKKQLALAENIETRNKGSRERAINELMDSDKMKQAYEWHRRNKTAEGKEDEMIPSYREYIEIKKKDIVDTMITNDPEQNQPWISKWRSGNKDSHVEEDHPPTEQDSVENSAPTP